VEVASSAIIGGLTLKALYALSKATQKYFIQPKVRGIVNKAYQKVTKKNKKLLKRTLNEDDLEFLQNQIDDIYLILEYLWEETNNEELSKLFLEELQKTVNGLKIEFDDQLTRVRILEEKTDSLDTMIFHRFEVVYDALEDIFSIINSYDNRISRLEEKMSRIEERMKKLENNHGQSNKVNRPLVPAITIEMASEKKYKGLIGDFITKKQQYKNMSKRVGNFKGTENEFEIAVELGKEVLEAYLYGAVTFDEAVDTLEIYKESLKQGHRKTKDIIKVRELTYLIDAIKEQIIILQETKIAALNAKKEKKTNKKEIKRNPLII